MVVLTVRILAGSKGIGYQISLAFATAGAKVVILSREEEAAQEAIQNIRSHKADAKVDWVRMDLGDLSQTLGAVTRLANSLARVDLVS